MVQGSECDASGKKLGGASLVVKDRAKLRDLIKNIQSGNSHQAIIEGMNQTINARKKIRVAASEH